jgi:hypothetical protein
MELVFALITYIGVNKVDESYFKSIDNCMYYASRINKNLPVPGKEISERFSAICKPVKINLDKNKVY